jgi:hypothetical protein
VNHLTLPKADVRIGAVAGGIGCLVVVGALCTWVLYIIIYVGKSLWLVYLLKCHGLAAVAQVTGYTPQKRWAGGRHNPDIQVHFHTRGVRRHSGKYVCRSKGRLGPRSMCSNCLSKPEVVAAGECGDSLMTLLYGMALESYTWDGLMC